MGLFKSSRSKKSVSIVRIISAVLVLGVLVLLVAESAKYIYVLKVPKSVTSRIDPSIDKLAAVLGAARSSLQSINEGGDILVYDSDKSSTKASEKPTKQILAKLAILADSHNDLDYLQKALTKAKSSDVDRIFFLGDYTDWGEVSTLEKSKQVMDSLQIPYVSIPGDHDIGETRDETNFVKVFGKTCGMVDLENIKIVYFDNSKNYTTIDSSSIEWFNKEIKDADFLLLSQPLMTESMLRVMGIVDGVKDESVYAQNIKLLETVRNSSVRVIISGDLHQFTKYQDPVKKDLWHYSVGAVLKSQSLEKLNLQSPRFVILTVYDDKSYEIQDTTID